MYSILFLCHFHYYYYFAVFNWAKEIIGKICYVFEFKLLLFVPQECWKMSENIPSFNMRFCVWAQFLFCDVSCSICCFIARIKTRLCVSIIRLQCHFSGYNYQLLRIATYERKFRLFGLVLFCFSVFMGNFAEIDFLFLVFIP